MYQDNNKSGLLAGFALGVAAGMPGGLLLAPKPCVEIRKAIWDLVDQAVEQVRQLREEFK